MYLDELSVMHILISSKLIPDKRLLEISKTCELGWTSEDHRIKTLVVDSTVLFITYAELQNRVCWKVYEAGEDVLTC